MTKRSPLFVDLRDAGHLLAKRLENFKDNNNVLVLGVVRAGVPLAIEVAKSLQLPLDVACVRRLLPVQGTNEPMCAVTIAGSLVLDDRLTTAPATRDDSWQFFLKDALEDLAQRTQLCRRDTPVVPVEGRTVLLVDNGISSGHTICAVIRALRTLGPARVVVAVPIAAAETKNMVENAADKTICLGWHSPFGHVGLWYRKLDVPGIEKVNGLLKEVLRKSLRET